MELPELLPTIADYLEPEDAFACLQVTKQPFPIISSQSEFMDLPPELRHLIEEHLEIKDFVACLQVSRAWHDYFSEKAYRFAAIHSTPSDTSGVPPLGWSQKYGGLIQHLSLSSNTPLLQLLTVADTQEQHQRDRKTAVVLFPKLKRLDVSTCCTLKEVDNWLLHCPRLESLTLCDVRIPTFDMNTGETIRVAHFSKHCPRLRRLEIDNRGYYGVLKAAHLAEIISCWPPLLTEFRLLDSGSPRAWFLAMSDFLERMTVLDFYECAKTEDWMLKTIMCSCPLLVELRWFSFDANALFIEEDAGAAPTTSATSTAATTTRDKTMGPWTCTGLKKLALSTVSWSESPLRNSAAMEYLGMLRELRLLTIHLMTGDIDIEHGPWPDEPRTYLIEDFQMVPEVQWMRETWPLLEYFKLQRWSWI